MLNVKDEKKFQEAYENAIKHHFNKVVKNKPPALKVVNQVQESKQKPVAGEVEE